MCGKVIELKSLNESLHKDKMSQERELRKLRKEVQQYEQMIMSLKSEISLSKYCTPNVSKQDAEVMAGMCCTGAECGDWEPVKDYNSVLREEMISYQERIQKMEVNLKASGAEVRALRAGGVRLREELAAARAHCAALYEQCRAARLRGHFKDDIIKEMRRQLKHAKAKSKEASELISMNSRSHETYDSVTIACVRQQPRSRVSRDSAAAPPAARDAASVVSRSHSADDGRSPRLVVSEDDLLSFGPE